MPTPESTRTEELAAFQRERRNDRRARRVAREKATGIKALNMIPMMGLMTILVVSLLKSHQATSTSVATQERISITVSMHEVAVNDRKVVPLTAGVIPPAYKEGGKAEAFYVGSVFDALKKEVDKRKQAAQDKNAPFSGRINVIVDKKVTYRTLMELLYTAGQAGLGEYQLLVKKDE
jgi:biopolymer transport protein ExbD